MSRNLLRRWLIALAACLAVAQAIHLFEPAEYGSFVQRFLTPYLFPGLFFSVLISGNYHSDPIPVVIVVGTGLVWSVPVFGLMVMLKRRDKPAA